MADRPIRVQLSRAKGWRMPPNTIKVDRTTKWGNPWEVWRDEGGQWWCTYRGCAHQRVDDKASGMAVAVERFRLTMEMSTRFYGGLTNLLELRGKNLACWCKPGAPCHADVLLELANQEEGGNA